MSADPFFMVSKSLTRSKRISRTAKLLLAVLVDHRNSETKKCNPKLATLAEELGTSRRTVQRATAELCHLGLLQITRGQRQSNYSIPPRSEWSEILKRHTDATEQQSLTPKWRDSLRQSGASAPAVLITELDQLNETKNPLLLPHQNSTSKPRRSPAKKPLADSVSLVVQGSLISEPEPTTALVVAEPEPESFEVWFETKFWPHYWRKVGKAAALKAARRVAGKSPKLRDEIAVGLYRQLPGMQSRELRFRPHASTWINEERWRDEPEAPRRPVESQRDRNFRIAAEMFLKEPPR
jgi:hypothetical protein